ncbi:MAG: OmpA family protein [Bdellovibrio sp.]|nr:OmpA family protein [Bdellovibrio sp.]
MKTLVCITAILLAATIATAAPRIELGAGGGTTHPFAGDTFKNQASTGDSQIYWIGYGLTKNWGLELGLDNLDFDNLNTKHQAYNLSGVYRFAADTFIHPIAKLGVGSVESKLVTGEKTTALGGKAAGGIEADFKYVSFGALINYHYFTKAGDADVTKNMQALTPALFISIHNATEYASKSTSEAPAAVAAPVAATAKKDSDGDGVSDEDDKCPNTPAGILVNAFGCAEKEKASIKLNIEFLVAKATFDPSFNSEIQNLASFMRRFSDTTVEIAGYTDNQGLAARNALLSQKRADAVKTALIKAGVEPTRIQAKGYGEEKAIADNKTAEGRKQNRRVMAEISVTTDKKK